MLRRLAAVLILLVPLAWATPAQGQYQTHPLEAPGTPPTHGYFSLLPWEQIDMMTGSVVLTFPMVSLPGSNGMDVTVVATYNSKGTWETRFGPKLVVPDAPPLPSVPWVAFPSIRTPDGGTMPTFPVTDENGTQFRSTTHWLVDRAARTLSLPDGTVFSFDADGRMTERRDPYDNRITASYDGATTTLVQYLYGGAQQRTVVIVEEAATTTVSYHAGGTDNRQWTWTRSADLHTTTYQPPIGRPWVFVTTPGSVWGDDDLDSDLCNPGVSQTLSVETPEGGRVEYDFRRCVRGYKHLPNGNDQPRFTRRVAARRAGGRAIDPATWTFTFSMEGLSSSVEGAGRRIEFEHRTYGLSTHGLTAKRVYTDAPRTLLEAMTISWWERTQHTGPAFVTAFDLTAHPEQYDDLVRADPYPLLVHQVRTTRGDAEVWTDFDYQPTHYNDYGHPWRVSEHGSFDRTTSFGYQHDGFGSHYVVGKVVSVQVTGERVSGESPLVMYTDTYTYDAKGFRIRNCPYLVCASHEPTPAGDLSIHTDARGETARYFNYSWGLPGDIAAPEHSVSREINADGTIASETRDIYTRRFTRDVLGREVRRELLDPGSPGGKVNLDVVTVYAPDGTAVTVSRGASWTRTSLDGFGRAVATENAVGVKTTTVYDAWGATRFESYPFSGSEPTGTTIVRDALGRVVSRHNPDGTVLRTEYAGLTVTITDEEGRRTVQRWEAAGDFASGRLGSVTDAAGHETRYRYDAVGALVRVIHSDNAVRSWTYDDTHHRLLSETHPEAGTVHYTHDAVGNVQTRTDGNGVVLHYTHDGDNRVTAVAVGPDDHPDGTPYDVAFHYDGWGNRDRVENRYVSRQFAYQADRLRSATDWVRPTGAGAWSRAFITTYDYDGQDNLASITYPVPEAAPRTVSYAYDAGNRIDRVYEGSVNYASDFAYHPSGAVSGYTSGNGVVNTVTYDAEPHQRNWPAAIAAGRPGYDSVLALGYTYDNVGNVTHVTGGSRGAQAFDFDVLDRLRRVTATWGTEEYTYDSVGNRVWTNEPSGTRYGYEGNRLASLSGAEHEALEYDAGGRLTRDGRGEYTYTPFDLLEEARMYTGITPVYRYDGDQQRTVSTVGGSTRFFLHGPGNVLLSEVTPEAGAEHWRTYIYAGARLIASLRSARTHVRLAIEKRGRGTGTVGGTIETVGAVLDCGNDCGEAAVPVGRTLVLTATAAPGSKFVGWSGSCHGQESPLTVAIGEDDLDCRARFIIPTPLTVGRDGRGTGTVTARDLETGQLVPPDPVTGAWEFDIATPVQLVADPVNGSVFVAWAGDCSGSDPRVTLTMTAAKACVAKFVPVHWLTVSKTGPGGGLVAVTSAQAGLLNRAIACGPGGGACAIQFPEETVVTLSVGSHLGVTVTGWSGAGCVPDPADPTRATVLMDQPRTCTAAFRVSYPKTAPTNGSAGIAGAVTVSWGAPMADVGNWVCWDTTDNGVCDHPLGWLPNGALTSRDMTGLLSGTTYFWQVRATLPEPDNSQVEANDGAWWHFTTGGSAPVTKQSPVNGASGLGTTVTLEWALALADPAAWVCWDTSDNGTCDTMWWPNGGGLSRALEGLTPGVYYWQVRADTAGGSLYGDGGTWWSFRVGAPPPAPPGVFTKLTPAAESVGVSVPVALGWGASAGATSYEYCVDTSDNGACDGTWQAAAGSVSATVSGVAASTTYYWQVRAWNSAGSREAADGWRSFTTAAMAVPPGSFTKTAPATGGANVATPVALSWGASAGASSYEYCVDTTANGACDGSWQGTGAGRTASATGLAASTGYVWQVRARNADGVTEASGGWWGFTTAAPPAAVTKQSPAQGTGGHGSTVTLAWSTTLSNPGYWVCWDTSDNGTCDTSWWPNGPTTSRVLTGLAPSTTYSWQVMSGDGLVLGDHGTWWTFTTAAAPPAIAKLAPASGSTPGAMVTLQWTTTLSDPGYWVCWDGVNNGTCDTMWWPNGAAMSRLLENLAPGTYYWQVKSADGTVQGDHGTWWSFTVPGSPTEATETVAVGWAAPRPPPDGPRSALGEGAGWWLAGLVVAAVVVGGRRRGAGVRAGRGVWARLALVLVLSHTALAGVAAGQSPGTAIEYYHLDALGSVRAVTDATGAVLRTHDYHPFGEALPDAQGLRLPPERKMFTGHERDSETALDYFGARYYRAGIGRFTTVDPAQTIGENLVDPQRWNRYAYARNNPLRFTDPDGRDIWDIVNGALNAFASNAGFAPRSSGNSDYRKGQLIGDVGSLVASGAEFVGGGTVSGSGVVACGTGVGCLVGAPAVAEGAGMMTHSVVFGANAGISLMKSFSDGGGEPKSVNQMNQQVKRGQAPDGVTRVDKGKVKGEQDNVHFGDGSSLNRDGTWKHGGTRLTREQEQWLRQNGWAIPR